MAKPIPTNEAGLRNERRYDTTSYTPAWGMPEPVPSTPIVERSIERWSSTGLVFLAVSGLTGGVAVASALGVWPVLAATNLGLQERNAFYLLAGGVYLLATALYAAWRTRLLYGLNQAPWDARLMAYGNLAVGGFISLALGIVVLAAIALILLLVGFGALLLSDKGGQPQG